MANSRLSESFDNCPFATASQMGKAEVVKRIAEETHLTRTKTAEIVETIFDEIKGALQHGDSVILWGFGSFQVGDKPARTGRSPKQGTQSRFNPAAWFCQSRHRLKAAANTGVEASPPVASEYPVLRQIPSIR
jgi:DNA-binding protein HU-beta